MLRVHRLRRGFAATTDANPNGGDEEYLTVGGAVFHPAAELPTIDVSNGTNWTGSLKTEVPASPGDRYDGWTTIGYGSVIPVGSCANNTSGGSIPLGSAPEPGSHLLPAIVSFDNTHIIFDFQYCALRAKDALSPNQ